MIFSAHLSMLFRELPYLERPRAAAEAGFTAVETWWPDAPAGAWADEVARHGLAVTAINAAGGDLEAGDRGFLNVAAQRDRSVAGFRRTNSPPGTRSAETLTCRSRCPLYA